MESEELKKGGEALSANKKSDEGDGNVLSSLRGKMNIPNIYEGKMLTVEWCSLKNGCMRKK